MPANPKRETHPLDAFQTRHYERLLLQSLLIFCVVKIVSFIVVTLQTTPSICVSPESRIGFLRLHSANSDPASSIVHSPALLHRPHFSSLRVGGRKSESFLSAPPIAITTFRREHPSSSDPTFFCISSAIQISHPQHPSQKTPPLKKNIEIEGGTQTRETKQ